MIDYISRLEKLFENMCEKDLIICTKMSLEGSPMGIFPIESKFVQVYHSFLVNVPEHNRSSIGINMAQQCCIRAAAKRFIDEN